METDHRCELAQANNHIKKESLNHFFDYDNWSTQAVNKTVFIIIFCMREIRSEEALEEWQDLEA